MKPSLLAHLSCPSCHADLVVRGGATGEITEGELVCRGCDAVYPVRRGIPRFVSGSAYAASFGREWNWFRSVQIDSQNGSDLSERNLTFQGWHAGVEYRR